MDLDFLKTPWGFGSVTVVTAGLCFILYRVGYIAFGKFQAGRKEKEKEISPHASCPHSKDIMDIIHRTADHYEKVQNLKSSIIKEQMRYYEEIEEEVLGHLKHIFTKLISNKLSNNEQFITHSDYGYYMLILKVIFSDLKSYVRNLFLVNHYITYSIEDQQDYIEKKKTIIVQKISESINDYWRGSLITCTEIYEKNKEQLSFFESQIKDVFNRAFFTAREVNTAIIKMEESYQNYIDSIVGVSDENKE